MLLSRESQISRSPGPASPQHIELTHAFGHEKGQQSSASPQPSEADLVRATTCDSWMGRVRSQREESASLARLCCCQVSCIHGHQEPGYNCEGPRQAQTASFTFTCDPMTPPFCKNKILTVESSFTALKSSCFPC